MEKELDQCYFADVAQFKELNEILRFDTRRDEITDLDLLGQIKMVDNGRFQMTIVTEELDDVEFRFVPSTHRLLMIILEELCKHNRQELKISVDSYMDRCDLANKAELRKQLKVDLQCLKAIRFDIVARKGKKMKDCRLCDIAELGPSGLIYVRLSEDVVKTWKKHLGFLQFPRLYFTLNRRQHRDAPMLLYYISLMRHISNKSDRHKDVLRIETLLSVTSLPTIEEVRDTSNGGIQERIVRPFLRELHALESELKFQFVFNGKSISEDKMKKLRFEDFVEVCVHFTWVHEEQFFVNGKIEKNAG